ncbi:uncharacterized protein IL334_003136 [Kwoniella shivajii]|uniref:Uncharacterized protein n=1 Tax=Kwoniella shivajii TaxID=564305 RepID=A0ABZ1CWP8_9TREE|nr:hypothetical protein IL334_003136 [Kwoniella shivajii]
MADLTPPSSHNSTPVRPSNEDHPPSPTAGLSSLRPHPLTKTTSMDVDHNLSGTESGSEDELDMVDQHDIEGEDVAEGEGGIQRDEIMSSDEDERDDQEGEGQGKGKAREEVRDTSGKKSKGRNRRSRKYARPGSGLPGPSGKSARGAGAGGKKDGDLYESDIVNRWNREIGDVCSEGVANPTRGNPSISETVALVTS